MEFNVNGAIDTDHPGPASFFSAFLNCLSRSDIAA